MYPPSDPSETIVERFRKKPRALIVWSTLILLCLAAGAFQTALNFSDKPESMRIMAVAVVTAICALGLLVVVFILWPLARWLFLKNLRRAFLALAAPVALVVFFYVGEDWRGKRDWENFKQQRQVNGEKFDLASFVPPAVPDNQNFALTPIVASSYTSLLDQNGHELQLHNTNIVDRLSMRLNRENDWITPTNGDWAAQTLTDLRAWQAYYRAPLLTNTPGPFATNEFPVSLNPQSPAEDVLLALHRYYSDIEELRAAAALPSSRFPVAYGQDDPATILLPHLWALSWPALALQLRAIAELQLVQPDEAAADIKLILRLADATRNEPFLISALVRMRLVNIARQPIYEGLANHRWSELQLAALDKQLAQLDFLADYQRSTRFGVVYATRMIDYVKRTHQLGAYLEMDHAASPLAQKLISDGCRIAPAGWLDENRLGFGQFYLDECLPLVDMEQRKVSPAAVAQLNTKLRDELLHPRPYNALKALILFPTGEEMVMGNPYLFTENFAYAQECADLTRVAIALERHRIAHGNYPNSLSQLGPQFLAKVPHDVIGGGDLKYRATNKNFILYSIGWDGIDDGGIPATINNGRPANNGDWVWQYP